MSAQYFYQVEERDGVRFSWNIWPSSRIDAARMVTPLGAMYTPLKKGTHVPRMFYSPLQCKRCHAIINPYSKLISDVSKMWVCPFCFNHNQFPQAYSGITPEKLPAELLPQVTTIEYVLSRQSSGIQPVFLFVVDLCVREEELSALKDALLMSLGAIPPQAFVGLITFGTTVQVYELAFEHCPKSYVFRGDKDVQSKDVQKFLGLGQSGISGEVQASSNNRFILPLEKVEYNITSILEELQRDQRPVKNDRRPLRATGVALSVAIALLENTFPNTGARIMSFMGGPCTCGPGKVVGEELREPIRSHHDLNKEIAKHVHSATKHYTHLASRAVKNGHAIDLFSCALDQTGLLEMRELTKQTGGIVILSESFEHEIFQKSFQKMFEKNEKGDLKQGFNATIEVLTSRELKVCGSIGHMSSLNRRGNSVSDTEIGIGGTCAWKICALTERSTYAFYFEIVNQHSNKPAEGHHGMVQFLTQYQDGNGQRVLRVTTVAHAWASPNQGPKALIPGFDQEAAAALVSRIGVFKAEQEETNVIKWLDKQLIRLVARFANYEKEKPESLVIPNEFAVYPQFMFHLRRGPLVQSFNNSPDETVFYRYYLNCENTSNTLLMIQPTLDSYTFDQEPEPVLLNADSIDENRILLLDTFFHIVVFEGQTINSWKKAKYHEQPEYENFKDLLEAPVDDAQELMDGRFPYPMYVATEQGGSQARFLLATLDPTVTHMNNPTGARFTELIFTEDVPLEVFMEHLKKRAVDSEA